MLLTLLQGFCAAAAKLAFQQFGLSAARSDSTPLSISAKAKKQRANA
jgi:hypothetical protein